MTAPFDSRLREAMQLRRMRQADIIARTGITKSLMHSYVHGVCEPKRDNVAKLASALDVDPTWLFGGDVPMERAPLPANAFPVPALRRVPIIGTVRAGFNGPAEQDIEGYEYADVKNSDDCIYFRVSGDSMLPTISENDLALVRLQDDVESGELAVVVVNGDEGMLKKVIKKGRALVLQSFNPAYEPRVITGPELNTVHIVGKVLQTVRKW